jgi:phosphate:Na+ symporter
VVGELDLWPLARGVLGGLALFLLGMELITRSLTAAAGDQLRTALDRISRNRLVGAVAGAVATAAIQSSSVTTVLVVGFTSAGLLSLRGAIPMILGANIGSTATAQIVALDVTEQALVLVAIGFALRAGTRRERRAEYGGAVLGLGLVLLGLRAITDGTEPLRDWQPFLDLMTGDDRLLLGIVLGAAFTAVVQSSAATTGIVVVLGGEELISLEMGLAVVLGANIGTCVTAVVAAAGKSTDGRRAAAVHVLFNVAGALAWLGFLDQLASLVQSISPSDAPVTARQLANGHTIFNVTTTAIALTLVEPLARLVERLVPQRPEPAEPPAAVPRYLDQALLRSPVTAMELVRKELTRIASRVRQMLDDGMAGIVAGDARLRGRALRLDDEVDDLHAAVVRYLGELSVEPLGEAQHRELAGLLEVANELEQLGDVVEGYLAAAAAAGGAEVPLLEPGRERLLALHAEVMQWFDLAIRAVVERDPALAVQVQASKRSTYRDLDATADDLAEELASRGPTGVADYRRAVELVGHLRRVHQGCRRIARTVEDLPDES